MFMLCEPKQLLRAFLGGLKDLRGFRGINPLLNIQAMQPRYVLFTNRNAFTLLLRT